MSDKIGKDILFYSNYCSFSKEVINKVSKTPISDNLVYICVDDKNIQLPPFLKAVPTIYSIKDRQAYTDNELESYIESLIKPNQGVPTELDAYFNSNSNFSSNYSLLDNSEERAAVSSYSYIDQIGLPISTDNSGGSGGKASGMDAAYERLQQERQNDFQGIKRV